MVFQNSCVVPFGTTAMVNVFPALSLAPAAGCLDPASPPPLHAAAARAKNSAAAAERRVVVNESLQRDEVGRRESGTSRRQCTGRPREAAELEHDDALHVVGAPMVAGEGGRYGVERGIAVRDERRDVDPAALDELERMGVGQRSAVACMATR